MRVRLTTTEVRQLRETGSHPAGQRATDDGLTIVELIIALVLVMIVFSGLAATLIASFNAIRSNEARVVATALGNELIEEMYTMPWEQLGLNEDELANLSSGELADLNLVALPDDEYEFEGELLVQVPESGPPVPTVVRDFDPDGRTYTVERFVTWHLANQKRMVVIVRWEIGGREQSIRTEGLRSPDPDDELDLQVTISSIENVGGGEIHGENRVPLHPEGSVDKDGDDIGFKNVDPFEVTIWLGVKEASAELTFDDRDGNPQVLTTPSTGGGTVQRTFLIDEHAYKFPHGNVSFTVTATAPGDETATYSAVARFYQPVEVQDLRFTQDGEEVSEVTVCDGALVGDLVIEAEVWGLTPSEAAVEGALGLVWGRQPGSGEAFLDESDPLGMTHTDVTTSGADFTTATIEDGTTLLTSEGEHADGFAVLADRLLGTFDPETDEYTDHPLDDDDFERAMVIVEDCP